MGIQIEDGKEDRDKLAALDPENATPEQRATIAAARGTQLLDFMVDKNYSTTGTDTAVCMAALLYAAGLLANRAGLNPHEIAVCFQAGIRDGKVVADMVAGSADA